MPFKYNPFSSKLDEVNAAGGGADTGNRSYQLVSTTTVSSDATLEFTNLSEDLYLLVLKDLEFGDSFSSNRQISIRTSSNNGVSWDQTANDYFYSRDGKSSGGSTNSSTSITATEIQTGITSADTDNPGRRSYSEIFIANIGNASRNTTIFGTGYGADGDYGRFGAIRSAVQDDNAVQLDTTGSFIAGTCYLYKIVEGV